MPRLTDQEKQEILRFLEADKPLPDNYRFLLFEDKREVLTGHWTGWIDYWSVNFDFESKRELSRVPRALPGQGHLEGQEPPQGELTDYEEVRTGDYVFENEWQSFRPRKGRSLDLTSATHECPPGPKPSWTPRITGFPPMRP